MVICFPKRGEGGGGEIMKWKEQHSCFSEQRHVKSGACPPAITAKLIMLHRCFLRNISQMGTYFCSTNARTKFFPPSLLPSHFAFDFHNSTVGLITTPRAQRKAPSTACMEYHAACRLKCRRVRHLVWLAPKLKWIP